MFIITTQYEKIAVRAYYLWEDEGRPLGRHHAHWLAAEETERMVPTLADAQIVGTEAAVHVAAKPIRKPAPTRKAAPVKKAVSAVVPEMKASTDTVVAAAALQKTPRVARTSAKSLRSTQ